MSSLLALLSQQSPSLRTRKGLILTGLQNDFLSPTGKLPVDTSTGFVERLKDLAIDFRDHGGIIWVRSEFEATRHPSEIDEDGCNVITAPTAAGQGVAGDASEEASSEGDSPRSSRKRKAGADDSPHSKSATRVRQSKSMSAARGHRDASATESDVDEELFLTRTVGREPCCIKGTSGAAFAADIAGLVQPNDLKVVKSYYSAFSSTSLLLTLRSKLITELYIAGCMTNLSVYATAMDAARYGIKIILIEDCLGYRKRDRHDLAIERLVDVMEAKVMTAERVIHTLKNPQDTDEESDDSAGETNEIPVAPLAAHAQAPNLLEVDSEDDDDDEIELPSVRASLLTRNLPLRPLRSEQNDSRARVTGGRTSSEYSQPARVTSANSTEQRKSAPRKTSPDLADQRTDTPAASHASVKRGDRREKAPNEQKSAVHRRPAMQDILSQERPSRKSSHDAHVASNTSPRVVRNTVLRARKWNDVYQTTIERPRELPLLGIDKEEESGGSRIIYDLMPPDALDGLFGVLKDEVAWQTMHHQTGEVPRLVCCQGTIDDDGSRPVYRHPSDETLPLSAWSPTVDQIRQAAEAAVGHPLNHALIQLYRGGTDFISEHSDKTLDIAHDSKIVNVSFGAERVMRLRTKRANPPSTNSASEIPSPQERTTYRIRLPHNSALLMSLETNAQYLHGINPDKRLQSELTPAEKGYDGQRISLTFRHIDTFLSADSQMIWGQGARGKQEEDAQPVINGDKDAGERLVRAFGRENQASAVAWEEWYGEGSNVLHLKGS